MKVYLVGGAVRDKLLQQEIKERDWVVVGATSQQMLNRGFKKVGKDFPVFLHPQTKEEYALARKERKIGTGHTGFQCEFSKNVTLEEDLSRRDLTINAIALDENNNFIDPYNGLSDIKNKILRHVSKAFTEDPLRVLRVARFAARFHKFGFKIADTTVKLMKYIVKSGELKYLAQERIWKEFEKSLIEDNPEIFILILRKVGALEHLFAQINKLFGTPQSSEKFIDSGIKSIEALKNAVKLTKKPQIRFAALVHDINIVTIPIEQWPVKRENILYSKDFFKKFAQNMRLPSSYQQLCENVIQFHATINNIEILKDYEIVDILLKADAFRRPENFTDLLITTEAIYHKNINEKYQPMIIWLTLLKKCTKIDVQDIIKSGYQGHAINVELKNARIKCVRNELQK